MIALPKTFAWIENEEGPRILKELRKLYGTIEVQGRGNNPLILQWAKDIGLGNVYKADSVAWCGLTIAYAAAQAGWEHSPRGNALYARNWLSWGSEVQKGKEMLGDILVFSRKGGGHVAMYIAEDADNFYILGGNQGDAVSIKRKAKSDLLGARRCKWNVNQPANVRKIFMSAAGAVSNSINEA